ncbi:glutathione S-transferase [Thiomicrorhabdus arctica]|uniref:glutathione S-transferase n=1 Tax=Thiomicrorhabdus arctica TaxID=131540 RepID=UPI000361A261|nr:glutathione S-transferase [Thiomicrorhabdus arctica]
MVNFPILYSYRRCPYAMRARMAIMASGVQVEQREIVFWDKPVEMLAASPKGTVPVLILPDGQVIDESCDIMLWALSQSDKLNWLPSEKEKAFAEMTSLIDLCDNEFKTHLDHYKYAERFPDELPETYRLRGEDFLQTLEELLAHSFSVSKLLALNAKNISMTDIALFPFVRQFAHVDKHWFEQSIYRYLKRWLEQHLDAEYFTSIMKNRPVWRISHAPLWVSESSLTTRDQFLAKALAEEWSL